MTGEQQKVLPGFENIVPEVVQRLRRATREQRLSAPQHYELVHHPLDRKFRRKLHHWLEFSQKESNFKLDEVLSERYLRIVKLYLYPQPPTGEWIKNQGIIMAMVDGNPKASLKRPLTISLIMVWRRIQNGEDAIEILKFRPRDFLLYQSLTKHEIKTIQDIRRASPQGLSLICGAREIFDRLKVLMSRLDPHWNPKVIFPYELPPKEASDYVYGLRK